jgi:antirestriction protein ArdC
MKEIGKGHQKKIGTSCGRQGHILTFVIYRASTAKKKGKKGSTCLEKTEKEKRPKLKNLSCFNIKVEP